MIGQASKPGRAVLVLIATLLARCVASEPVLAQSTPAPAAETTVPASPAAPAPKLTGAAAWQLLVGNTVVAQSHDGGYTEFFAPDGVVKHLDRDGKATGTWTLQGDKVCFDFPDEDDRSCVQVEVTGQKGAFVDEDKARDTFDVLPGNAKGL